MQKILLIEDSGLSRNMFKQALGDSYTYLEAADGFTGLETYSMEKPDLVVLDLMLPGMDGFEVLRQLRQLDPASNIIIGSADIQEQTHQQAYNLGAKGFIQKPYTQERVQMVIQKVAGELHGN